MGSSSTDLPGGGRGRRWLRDADARLPAGAAVPAPPGALGADALAGVPGVLGAIARERAGDYAGARLPQRLGGAPGRPAFAAALRGAGVSVIAEVKRSSPSQGLIRDLDPVAVARAYAAAGAAAVSVLTEARHFGGSLQDLASVAAAVSVPLLRKDFVVHPAQLLEARTRGASAILLIAAVLGEALPAYQAFADALGLETLVEVHDENELDRAMRAGAQVIGANNRDLRSLDVDLGLAPRLLGLARDRGFAGMLVAESGYRTGDDVAALRGVADAVLVGSSLAASEDPGAALAAFLGPEASVSTEAGG